MIFQRLLEILSISASQLGKVRIVWAVSSGLEVLAIENHGEGASATLFHPGLSD
jgi:hypothetical protein